MDLIADVRQMIIALKEELSLIEIQNGWCEETRLRWLANFEMILDCLESGKATPDASIARAMDFDGICKGKLLERAALISTSLRSYNANGK